MTDWQATREAYARMAEPYIAMCEADWPDDDGDTALVERQLVAVNGPVFDLGCGPGHWTARLHDLGVEVTGIDVVPAFITHARARYPGVRFELGSMTDPRITGQQVAGILSWYSTIHLGPDQFDAVLLRFRQLLAPGGVLVLGFFDSDDGVAAFDHAVTTAYRRPLDLVADGLCSAGFDILEHRRHRRPDRPDRRYAAIAARAATRGDTL